MHTRLTTFQAFNAMTNFLDTYYERTKSGDIGSLLGDMSFLQDGCTADPSAWEDWIDAIKTENPVTGLQAFKAMINFLDAYYKRTSSSSEDLRKLLNKMKLKDGKINDPNVLELWEKCIDEALEGSMTFLELKK